MECRPNPDTIGYVFFLKEAGRMEVVLYMTVVGSVIQKNLDLMKRGLREFRVFHVMSRQMK